MPRITMILFFFGLSLCLTERSVAQTPTAAWPSFASEAASGAALDVAVRLPFIAPTWQQSFAKRMALTTGTSILYERFVDVNGWSWQDVGQRAVGTLMMEVLFFAAHTLF